MEKKLSGLIYAGAVLLIRFATYFFIWLVFVLIITGVLTLACKGAQVTRGLPAVIERELAKPPSQSKVDDLRFLLAACNENQKALEAKLLQCEMDLSAIKNDLSRSNTKAGKFDGIKYTIYWIGALAFILLGLWLYFKVGKGLL